MLGLLTAAQGGLSCPDLQELTGAPLWEIEDVLHTLAGRTFTRQIAWVFGSQIPGPEVYLLGHEELQAAAIRYLGKDRLAGCRDRLDAWVDTYCAKGWPPPPGTPSYIIIAQIITMSHEARMHHISMIQS